MRFQAPLLVVLAFACLSCRNAVEEPDPVGEGEGEGEGDIGGEGEGEGEGDPCAGPPERGLVVPVEDNVTRFRICGATVEVQDGDYIETLVQEGTTTTDCQYFGAENRPGNYEIRASAPDYEPFTVSGIPVDADECGKPVTRTVTVRLNPL